MTRKRRYLISAAALAACVCIALGVLAMMPARPGVTKANFDRIEVGMSQAAVSEIFGKEFSLFSGLAGGTKHDFYARVYWFHEDCASAKIEFHNDSVVVMTWTESTETIPDKLRRWLHLPK